MINADHKRTFTEIMKELGERWRSMSEAEREVYNLKSE
jgi:hypothetical protein